MYVCIYVFLYICIHTHTHTHTHTHIHIYTEVPLSKEQQQQTTEAKEHPQQQTAILVWFRPEFRNTVTYAGVPPADEDIGYMGPRASFAAFDQVSGLTLLVCEALSY
jgi:hypothetical protein